MTQLDNTSQPAEDKAVGWNGKKKSYQPRSVKPRAKYADTHALSRADYGKDLSEKMIALLREGKTPWGGEEHTETLEAPHNPVTGTVYSGSNQVALMVKAAEKGFNSNKWITFAQMKQLGGKFISDDSEERKGAKIRMVKVEYALKHTTMVDSEGDPLTMTFSERDQTRRREKMRELEAKGWRLENELFQPAGTTTLFNLDQISDLGFYHDIEPVVPKDIIPKEMLAKMIEGMGVKVIERGHRVNYVPLNDTIFIPRRALFEREEDYDVALAHGAALATGAAARMGRETVGEFNSLDYPREEFIAQLASGLICSRIGVGSRLNRTEYTQEWIEMLEKQPEAIMDYIGHAQNAAAFVLGSSFNSPNKTLFSQYRDSADAEVSTAKAKNIDIMYPDGFEKDKPRRKKFSR